MDNRPTVDFDQHGADYAANSREQLANLRAQCPVAWTEAHGGFWIITKHEDILHIERHHEIFSCDNDLEGTRRGGKGIRIPSSLIRFSLNESDPPEHTALRKLEAPFVSVQALQRWLQLARELVDDQIDSVIEKGEADLVHDVTIPVPYRNAAPRGRTHGSVARFHGNVPHFVSAAESPRLPQCRTRANRAASGNTDGAAQDRTS